MTADRWQEALEFIDMYIGDDKTVTPLDAMLEYDPDWNTANIPTRGELAVALTLYLAKEQISSGLRLCLSAGQPRADKPAEAFGAGLPRHEDA
jgi:hypothetical protein